MWLIELSVYIIVFIVIISVYEKISLDDDGDDDFL